MAANESSGELRFENISGQINNLSNLPDEQNDLEISLTSQLMGKGELNLDWSFNVNDPNQIFLTNGSLTAFDAASLNDFLPQI